MKDHQMVAQPTASKTAFLALLSLACAIAWPLYASANDGLPGDESQDLMALYLQGKELVRSYQGDRKTLDDAERIFKETLERNNQFAPAYAGLADVLVSRGFINYDNYDPAVFAPAFKLLDQAFAADPNCVQAYTTRAAIRLHQKDRTGAREDLEKALVLDPHYAGTYSVMGHLYAADGDGVAAIEAYHRAIQLAGSDQPQLIVSTHSALAGFYQQHRRYAEAEAEYRAVLEQRPDSPWAWVNYGSFLRETGNVDGAIAACEKTLSLADFGMGRYQLARAYYSKAHGLYWEQRDREAAKPWLDKSIELHPTVIALYTTGDYWRERALASSDAAEFARFKARSIEHLKAALELDPNDQNSADVLAHTENLQLGDR